ncbi:MAG: hypothetical protein ACI9FB_001145 [Candidatus Azotimanducaceae bacterium]|jgi:hypothetical protein
MDVPTTLALCLSFIALCLGAGALFVALRAQRTLGQQADKPRINKNENYAEIANMLSDGALVWQQLVVQCDELSANLSMSNIQQLTRESIGDWLLQLRDFSKSAKIEIDHAYQLFAVEAKSMTPEEMALQKPDMEKFNKEMRSNVAAISGQLDQIGNVMRGNEALGNRQFKITLHKPQVMPHFLRKRQKMAELQRRRMSQQEPATAH